LTSSLKWWQQKATMNKLPVTMNELPKPTLLPWIASPNLLPATATNTPSTQRTLTLLPLERMHLGPINTPPLCVWWNWVPEQPPPSTLGLMKLSSWTGKETPQQERNITATAPTTTQRKNKTTPL
jgi:hypothetical protein